MSTSPDASSAHHALFIEGKLTFLRPLLRQDLRPAYLNWLNNPALTTYSAHFRSWPTTEAELEDFFAHLKGPNHVVLAACCKETGVHFGNFSLDGIDWVNRRAESNGMIGLPQFRAAHYLDVMHTLAQYAFRNLNLRRLHLGTEIPSVPPLLERLGWKREGTLRGHNFRFQEYVDVFLLGLLREDHEAQSQA